MASNFPDFMRKTLIYQSKNLNMIYRKIFTPRHMTVKLLKDKHKLLKAVGESNSSACDSSSLAFCVMYSAHKLNKQKSHDHLNKCREQNPTANHDLKKNKNLDKLGIEGKFQFDDKYLQKTYN